MTLGRGIILGLVAALLAGYAWMTARYFGFPDGHLTELERAEKPLYQALLYGNLAFAIYFGSRRAPHPVAILLWVLALIFLFGYDHNLSQHLDNGRGG